MNTSTRTRLSAAAAAMLLLAGGAACTADDTPTPAASPTASSTATERASAAPGPSTTPGTELPAPATTPVPQPSEGSTGTTVAPKPEQSEDSVDLDQKSSTGEVAVELTRIRSVNAEARLPGEVGGAALALTVTVTNGSDAAIDLDNVVVTLANSEDAPAGEMTGEPADPLAGSVAAEKSKAGVYVFRIDKDQRTPITVTVTLSGETPALVFKGDVD